MHKPFAKQMTFFKKSYFLYVKLRTKPYQRYFSSLLCETLGNLIFWIYS